MESVNNYKFYSFQNQIPPTPQYDMVMKNLAMQFQNAIKQELAKGYPYATGYNGSKKQTGIRDMRKKTGNLYNSVKVSFDPTTDQIKVVMLNYWKYVNDGRKAGSYVPIKPLMDWIKVKGMNRDVKGRFKKFNVKGTAFAISKSIQKFGIRPTNFYDNAFDIFVQAFEDEAVQALGIDMTTFFKKIVETEIK
jgi:hypothetical protein